MAEIPVEKKSGVPGWLWVLLALLLLGLLIWALTRGDEEEAVATTPVVAEETAVVGTDPGFDTMGAAATAGAVTSLAALSTATPGTTVDLDGVRVQSVVSDTGFWVGDDATQPTYVVLDETATPNAPIEGQVDVNSGQMISLEGTVRSAAEGTVAASQPLPEGVNNYIFAENIEVAQATEPMSSVTVQ